MSVIMVPINAQNIITSLGFYEFPYLSWKTFFTFPVNQYRYVETMRPHDKIPHPFYDAKFLEFYDSIIYAK